MVNTIKSKFAFGFTLPFSQLRKLSYKNIYKFVLQTFNTSFLFKHVHKYKKRGGELLIMQSTYNSSKQHRIIDKSSHDSLGFAVAKSLVYMVIGTRFVSWTQLQPTVGVGVRSPYLTLTINNTNLLIVQIANVSRTACLNCILI